jgi:hypothetical protein
VLEQIAAGMISCCVAAWKQGERLEEREPRLGNESQLEPSCGRELIVGKSKPMRGIEAIYLKDVSPGLAAHQ